MNHDVLAAAFDATPGNAALIDSEGHIVAVNEGWREFGALEGLATENAAVGANYLSVCGDADDDWGDEAYDGLEALLAGDRDRFTLEYPCHSPDEKRWFLLRAVTFDHEDEPYVLVTHLDITDRKEAELEVTRRNEELSDIVSLLAHDVRNPLSAAQGWLDAITPSDDTETEAIKRVRRSLTRIGTVVDDALTFMRAEVESEQREPVSLGSHARTIWDRLETGEATLIVAADTTVVCFPNLLDHLLENLFQNALDHAGPAVTVEVGTTDEGFYVADDGPGIPESDRASAFEAGFTTHETGSGFGLAIVKSVAERHGWELTLADSDAGARFEVRTRPAYGDREEPSVADD